MTFPVVFHRWLVGFVWLLCRLLLGEVVGVSIVPFYCFDVSVVEEFIAALCSCYPFGEWIVEDWPRRDGIMESSVK